MTFAAALRSPRVILAVKGILSLVIFGYILYRVQPAALAASVVHGNAIMLVLALCLLLPNLFLQFWKWRSLLRTRHATIANGEAARSMFIGFTLGIVTPARVGELAGRALAVESVDRMHSVGLSIVDKFASVLVTITAGVLGSLWLLIEFHYVSVYLWYPISILLAILIYASAWLILHPPFVWRMIQSLPSERPLRARLERLFGAIVELRPTDILRVLAVSMVFYLVFTTQFLLLVLAFETRFSVGTIAAIAAAFFAKTLIPPITFGELGIREASAMYFLSILGYADATAVNAALVLFVLNVLLPALIGLFFFSRLPSRLFTSRP